MISVIVPAKDAAKTLGECLQALLHQNGFLFNHDYEVIVVDDGSVDNTAKIAERYAVKVILQANAGPGAARNAGARIAKGVLLAFTDADCAPRPTWLKELTYPFLNPEVVGVKGTYLTHQIGQVPRFVQLEYEYKYSHMRNQESIDFIDTYSAAYRKNVFLQNAGFDESVRILEDQEFSSRLARKGYHMVFAPKATVYHIHTGTFFEYLRKKFRIGYWKAFVLHTIPEKTFTDSHTAPTQRAEILLLGLLLGTVPFIILWPLYASIFFLTVVAIFLLTISHFLRFIYKRDPQVFWIAPWMLFGRAGALGLGLIKGFLLPPKDKSRVYPCQRMGTRLVKRLIDIAGGCIGLFLSAPIIACAAIAIRLDSNGPIIFKQLRAGEHAKPFTIFKLRTMVDGAEQMVTNILPMNHLIGPAFKIPDDPRATRVGRFLRRWSSG